MQPSISAFTLGKWQIQALRLFGNRAGGFKVAQGLMEQALALAQQFGLSMAELGLVDRQLLPTLTLNAA